MAERGDDADAVADRILEPYHMSAAGLMLVTHLAELVGRERSDPDEWLYDLCLRRADDDPSKGASRDW